MSDSNQAQASEKGPKGGGREQETEQLTGSFLAGRILLLYGASGIGKTWLIEQAIVPDLKSRNFFESVRYFRFDTTPTTATAIPQRAKSNKPTCWIYDQLEVHLETASGKQAEDWFVNLAKAFDENLSVWVLLSLREEALPEFTRRWGSYFPRLAMFHLEGLKLEHAYAQIEGIFGKADAQSTQPGVTSLHVSPKAILDRISMPNNMVDPIHLSMAQTVIAEAVDAKVPIPIWSTGEELARIYYDQAILRALQAWNLEDTSRPLNELLVRLLLEQAFVDEKFRKRLFPTAIVGDIQLDGLPIGFLNLLVKEKRLLKQKFDQREDAPARLEYSLMHDRLISAVLDSNRFWRDRNEPLAVQSANWWALNSRNSDTILLGRALREGRKFIDMLKPHKRIHGMYRWAELLEFVEKSQRRQQVKYGVVLLIVLLFCGLGSTGGAYIYRHFHKSTLPARAHSIPADARLQLAEEEKKDLQKKNEWLQAQHLVDDKKKTELEEGNRLLLGQRLIDNQNELQRENARLQAQCQKNTERYLTPKDTITLARCKEVLNKDINSILEGAQKFENALLPKPDLGKKALREPDRLKIPAPASSKGHPR
jgi:hypothetical protein